VPDANAGFLTALHARHVRKSGAIAGSGLILPRTENLERKDEFVNPSGKRQTRIWSKATNFVVRRE